MTSVIGLFSSRLVLQELGINDFGLYGIIGGIVGMLNFLNASMISTSNRFIAIELGKRENRDIPKIFNTVFIIHLCLALLIMVFGEILGRWYIENHLNVVPNKISDALYVLDFSIAAAVLYTILVPYQGLLTAYEKFNVRTVFEILQSVLHLLLIFVISFLAVNKLRMYALLVFLSTVLIFVLHVVYIKFKFKDETKWRFNDNMSDYKSVTGFFGWTMFYVLGSTGSRQGAALILNSFFGTTLNAAHAIAARVFEMVYSFVKNLNQAAVPQIMINFSAGNQEKSVVLIYNLCKFTFFIMYVFSLPLLLSMDSLLEIWLKDVPDYSAVFASLMIIHGLLCCLESGFDAAIDSTGIIRKTKLYFNIIMLLTLPILYILYYFGFPPYVMIVVTITAELVFLTIQLKILEKLINFSIPIYLKRTVIPVTTVILFTLPQLLLRGLFDDSFISVILFSLLSVVLTLLTIMTFGLNKTEITLIFSKLQILKTRFIK